jgi:alpha-2-macroglobulin
VQTIDVSLTTPDGKVLTKTLTVPVQVNDPEIARISRWTWPRAQSFTFDDAVFAGLVPARARRRWPVGPLARLNAPGLLAALDRYPYGCTEQMTSGRCRCSTFDEWRGDGPAGERDNICRTRSTGVAEMLANQSSKAAFGLWGPHRATSGWMPMSPTSCRRARRRAMRCRTSPSAMALDNLRNR